MAARVYMNYVLCVTFQRGRCTDKVCKMNWKIHALFYAVRDDD